MNVFLLVYFTHLHSKYEEDDIHQQLKLFLHIQERKKKLNAGRSLRNGSDISVILLRDLIHKITQMQITERDVIYRESPIRNLMRCQE